MSTCPTTRIYLVRHGTTDWNQQGRLQGLRDTPLNATGVRDAYAVVQRLSSTPVSGVVVSPLSRARTTADILSTHLAVPLEIDARLREVDHGDWMGLTVAQIARRHPDAVHDGRLQGDAPLAVRAESLASAYRRASALLADVLRTHLGQSLVMVGHGVTNALLFVAAAGGDTALPDTPLAPNAGGVVMTFQGRSLAEWRPIDIEGHP